MKRNGKLVLTNASLRKTANGFKCPACDRADFETPQAVRMHFLGKHRKINSRGSKSNGNGKPLRKITARGPYKKRSVTDAPGAMWSHSHSPGRSRVGYCPTCGTNIAAVASALEAAV